MLPRAGRLRQRQAFQQAYSQGKRVVKDAFTLYAYSRGDDQPTRIGFVVGRRFGSHPVRNRVKRRLRAGIRPLWTHLKQGYDLVVVAREASDQIPVSAITQQAREAFQSLHLMKEDPPA